MASSSNPFASLSEDNQDQIRKYLRFLRTKKDGMLRALQLEIDDVKGDRLNEDVYTKEDVQDFADFLTSAIRSQITGDLSSIINMGALALNQLLESAQDKGVGIELETSALENHGLLDAVEKMSLDAMPKGARRAVQLTSFRDEAKAMREEASRLDETNNQLRDEVAQLKQRLALAERNNRNIAESKQQDEMMGKKQSKELERALEEAKEENAKRVSETTQFQQMRKIMQSQGAKIRDLSRRLQKYEPDAVKEDDEGDNY